MTILQQSTNLNEPQQEAVLYGEGPLLVLAGAGTGKTKVLTSRIIHIINSYLASPLQILAVTFTNKAAAEMKKRIGETIGEQVNNLWIGTFHSIAARITRRHAEIVGLKNDFTIIDQDDQLRLLRQIAADFNVDTKQFPLKNYLNKISRLKDAGASKASDDIGLPKFNEIFSNYQHRLKSMNAADFGDLLSYNLEIFGKNPEVLSYYQNKFKYVLVDEYQDTNNVQYQWLLHLCAVNQNICAVGDDDQSIYSWRGANIANILRFEKDFKNAHVIRLEQNYRSTANILKAADSVILNNQERHGKTLWTKAASGDQVTLFSFNDDRAEAANITETVKNYYQQKKYKLAEIAVLVRAGYQTRAFEEAFIKASLPYKIIGGLKFYERMEVKDAICYLRAIANPNDDLALSRIINVPKRGVGETTISNFYQKSKSENLSLYSAIKDSIAKDELKGKAKDALKFLIGQIEKWRQDLENSSLAEVAKLVLMESGYIQMWQSENTLEAEGRLENIDEFVNSLAEFASIVDFLEYVSLVEVKEDKLAQDAVNVMTVHAAKGLEFNLVFIPGLEDGLFPSGRSVEERNGLEEERRLLYVAITRARQQLILSYAKTRFVFGDYQSSMPSRFLKELPENIIKIEKESFSGFGNFSGYSGNSGRNYEGNSAGNSYEKSNNNFAGNSNKNFARANFEKQNSSNFSKQNYRLNQTVSQQISQKPSFVKNNLTAPDKANPLFGKRVFHQKFGYGKVVEIDGSKLEIDFEKSGRKIVMKDFVSYS